MKKIALLTALTVMLGTSGAFALCNCPNPNPYAYDYNRVSIATPVVVAPAAYNPCCNPCCGEKKQQKKSFFTRVYDGTKTVYQNTFGNLFTSMTGY